MPGMSQLILTVDYELFGNGSGSCRRCASDPLERMARLVERYDGRLEIFVEALEFAVMERSPDHAGAVAVVKRQLADMLARGHRLQLHIHPQWDEATPDPDAAPEAGTWRFGDTPWRTGDLQAGDLQRLLGMALDWIRDAVSGVTPDYRPTVFRAGGWCVQPSARVLAVLREFGLKADSSVAPGLVSHDPAAWFDFRQCPSRASWVVHDDVCVQDGVAATGGGGLLEIPIASARVNVGRHINARLARRREGEMAPGCRGSYRGRTEAKQPMGRLTGLWRKLLASRWAMLDFCTLPSELMTTIIRDWLKRRGAADGAVPVVAIGHTKNFSPAAELELEKLLIWVDAQPDLTLGGYADVIRGVAPVRAA